MGWTLPSTGMWRGEVFAISDCLVIDLCGGPVCPEDQWELVDVRFHWGSENDRGSEHTINNHAYPMEVSHQPRLSHGGESSTTLIPWRWVINHAYPMEVSHQPRLSHGGESLTTLIPWRWVTNHAYPMEVSHQPRLSHGGESLTTLIPWRWVINHAYSMEVSHQPRLSHGGEWMNEWVNEWMNVYRRGAKEVPKICSGTLRIAPRALHFLNFLGGDAPKPPSPQPPPPPRSERGH